MGVSIDETTVLKLNKLLQDLANFVALAEQTEDKLAAGKAETEKLIGSFKQQINEQLQHIQQALSEVSEVMTAAGAARWRIAAEKAMQQGEENVQSFKKMLHEFKVMAEKSALRLDHISQEAEKRIARVLSSLTIEQSEAVDHFKQRTIESFERVNQAASQTMKNVKKSTKGLRWDRFIIALLTAILTSLLTGFYINAELPWESYQKAVKERQIGRAVVRAWPEITSSEKERIRKKLRLPRNI